MQKSKDLGKKIQEIAPFVTKIKKEKSKNFQKAVKKIKNHEKYEFNHPLIERHFLFKSLQEVNEQLTKNNEGFLINFNSRFHEFFKQQLMLLENGRIH